MLLTASSGRMLLFHTGLIAPKTTKNTQGVQAMNLKKGQRLMSARLYERGHATKPQPVQEEPARPGACRKPVRTPGNS